jgi:hypothetical protein
MIMQKQRAIGNMQDLFEMFYIYVKLSYINC